MSAVDPLHARYPFFESAREAVRATDASLVELVAADAPAVARGRERVERALREGTTAPEDPSEWSDRDELLSYPIARILVSLLEDGAAIEKYATAEAETAADRFAEDVDADDGLRSTPGVSVSFDRLLREFGLSSAVRVDDPAASGTPEERYRVDVAAYLDLSEAEWGDDWRLVNRQLADGEVIVDRDELFDLLAAAARRRVTEGLPFEGLGEEMRDQLESQLSDLRALLADRNAGGDVAVDVVVPELFPPCIAQLRDRVAAGEDLSAVGRFSLVSFLVAVGLDADEIVALCDGGFENASLSYQVDRVRGSNGGVQYPPPSFETLADVGLCDDVEAHRDVAPHPLTYYERRLATAEEEYVDWRER